MPAALIVDDELETGRVLGLILGLRHYTSQLAVTGMEALEHVAQSPPDVVVLDLMLPDITGYEVARRLKSQRDTVSIPIVICSARLESDNLPRCFLAGATAYVAKPFIPPTIFQSLEAAARWREQISTQPAHGGIRLNAPAADFYADLSWLRNLSQLHHPGAWDLITPILDDLIRWRIRHEALVARSPDQPAWNADYHIRPDHLALSFPEPAGMTSTPSGLAHGWVLADGQWSVTRSYGVA
jgi:twitching motility two-component system response regulator PilH